jgi:hypothetical protein
MSWVSLAGMAKAPSLITLRQLPPSSASTAIACEGSAQLCLSRRGGRQGARAGAAPEGAPGLGSIA